MRGQKLCEDLATDLQDSSRCAPLQRTTSPCNSINRCNRAWDRIGAAKQRLHGDCKWHGSWSCSLGTDSGTRKWWAYSRPEEQHLTEWCETKFELATILILQGKVRRKMSVQSWEEYPNRTKDGGKRVAMVGQMHYRAIFREHSRDFFFAVDGDLIQTGVGTLRFTTVHAWHASFLVYVLIVMVIENGIWPADPVDVALKLCVDFAFLVNVPTSFWICSTLRITSQPLFWGMSHVFSLTSSTCQSSAAARTASLSNTSTCNISLSGSSVLSMYLPALWTLFGITDYQLLSGLVFCQPLHCFPE